MMVGSSMVPPLYQAVINMLQLDKLRSLKQLECSRYVFPGAKHSRLKYSLGLMYPSGQFLNALILKR